VEDAPPDRAEDPLTEEQREPDRNQKSSGDRRADGDTGVDRDTLDLVDDLAELGLPQLDVGTDEALEGVLRGPELLEKARRILRRVGRIRRRLGRGRGRIVGGGCGRLRLVQWGGLPASTWGTGR
jgi:hypothetical protein